MSVTTATPSNLLVGHEESRSDLARRGAYPDLKTALRNEARYREFEYFSQLLVHLYHYQASTCCPIPTHHRSSSVCHPTPARHPLPAHHPAHYLARYQTPARHQTPACYQARCPPSSSCPSSSYSSSS